MPAAMRATAALTAAAALALCGCRAERPVAAPAARHLVLVTIDTLRADRLGVYGHPGAATPHLDRLAREGAWAPQATVHVPLTRPSHASILTGLHPAEHGLRDNVSPPLRADVPVLAEALQSAGFRTAAFVSSIVLSAQSGLGRGFQTYGDRFEAGGGDDARFLNTIQKRGDVATGEAADWIRDAPDDRLFLWLHLYDPHDPYEPPEPYASRFADRPYDGEVAWSDELVGRVRAALEARGVFEDALFVVTSDHGEGLGEHGESAHGFFAYESTLRVPFIVRGRGVTSGGRLSVTARSVDIVPTALELLGVNAGGLKPAGRSLARELRGERMADEPAYAESLLPLLHYGWSDLRVLRDGRWKYIQAPRPELYDLQRDPSETANLAGTEKARAEALRTALGRRLEQERAAGVTRASAADVSPDLLEKLGALGYLGAGTPDAGASTGADPKDKLDDYKAVNRLMREGLVALRRKDHARSAERLGGILRRGIESFEVHYYLGRALAGLGRHREAASHFAAALARLPGYTAAYLELAESRAQAGDWEGARAALSDGQKASPRQASLFVAEARLWRQRRKPGEALRAYRAAIERAPRDALLHVQAGELARDLGERDEAVRLLRQAVAIEPSVASYWNSLGMVLGAGGDLPAAVEAFDQALAREPASARYNYNRGLALLRQGRADEAAAAFRRALTLQPRFAAAQERLTEMRAR